MYSPTSPRDLPNELIEHICGFFDLELRSDRIRAAALRRRGSVRVRVAWS
ncbi:BQ2448_5112 [Microbotryum intermedium]|uniref:BQ2448_5112 protein n=1 Tax=Microbotryum intermedium TaxID=269621 RepID=A0A238F643_9BASI|nr:BQ2448_5112 [Microbotryum intermedium]